MIDPPWGSLRPVATQPSQPAQARPLPDDPASPAAAPLPAVPASWLPSSCLRLSVVEREWVLGTLRFGWHPGCHFLAGPPPAGLVSSGVATVCSRPLTVWQGKGEPQRGSARGRSVGPLTPSAAPAATPRPALASAGIANADPGLWEGARGGHYMHAPGDPTPSRGQPHRGVLPPVSTHQEALGASASASLTKPERRRAGQKFVLFSCAVLLVNCRTHVLPQRKLHTSQLIPCFPQSRPPPPEAQSTSSFHESACSGCK